MCLLFYLKTKGRKEKSLKLDMLPRHSRGKYDKNIRLNPCLSFRDPNLPENDGVSTYGGSSSYFSDEKWPKYNESHQQYLHIGRYNARNLYSKSRESKDTVKNNFSL